MDEATALKGTSLELLGEVAPIISVDIGARNGSIDIRRIAPASCTYGFEPSSAEYLRLHGVDRRMDEAPRCGDFRLFPAAVCGHSGEVTLNISRRPGATSTLEPNPAVLDQFGADNWSELVDIVERVAVPAVTLAEFAGAAGLRHIDFLKLDTQGNELDILKSAGTFLNQVGVIKTEVEFLQMYRDQPLFDQVAAYLHDHGFELVDIEISPSCRRFHRFDRLPPTGYRLVWADLIMVRRPLAHDDGRALAKAAVLAAMGYADLASHIVHQVHREDARLCAAFDVMALELLRPATRMGRLRRFLERRLGVLMTRYDWRRGHQVRSLRPGP